MIYMVLLTTIGAASCPRLTPVENVQDIFRLVALPLLIWSSPLNRVLAKFFEGITQLPSSLSGSCAALTERRESAKKMMINARKDLRGENRPALLEFLPIILDPFIISHLRVSGALRARSHSTTLENA